MLAYCEAHGLRISDMNNEELFENVMTYGDSFSFDRVIQMTHHGDQPLSYYQLFIDNTLMLSERVSSVLVQRALNEIVGAQDEEVKLLQIWNLARQFAPRDVKAMRLIERSFDALGLRIPSDQKK